MRPQTCVLRAWDVGRPVVLCPAMNTFMWEHPFTAQHLAVVQTLPYMSVVSPVAKLLACGDNGTPECRVKRASPTGRPGPARPTPRGRPSSWTCVLAT